MPGMYLKDKSSRRGKTLAAVVVIGLIACAPLFTGGCQSSTALPMLSGHVPGRQLYQTNCGNCHMLLRPSRYDMLTWSHYVDKYGQNLVPQEKQLVLAYLQTARTQSVTAAN